VGSDVHPAFLPLFHPARLIDHSAQQDALKSAARLRLRSMFEQADARLADRDRRASEALRIGTSSSRCDGPDARGSTCPAWRTPTSSSRE
jgi:hypothetical protein